MPTMEASLAVFEARIVEAQKIRGPSPAFGDLAQSRSGQAPSFLHPADPE